MIDTGQEQFVINSLKDVYGGRWVDDYWTHLKEHLGVNITGYEIKRLLK